MNFLSYPHRRVFNEALRTRKNADSVHLAVIFLLTSNRPLWNRVKFLVREEDIRFDDFPMAGCTAEEYTLYLCAKDIYYDLREVTVSELADPGVISKALFGIIVSAMEIARCGTDLAKLRKGVNKM